MLSLAGEMGSITFYSLQKGKAAGQAHNLPYGMTLVDCTNELNDFSDTASLIENLDLVISVDTSVAHLAGALGKQVWTLLPFRPDWRWLLDRSDSPWYPTMRLFRQSSIGDWSDVIVSIKDALKSILGVFKWKWTWRLFLFSLTCEGLGDCLFAIQVIKKLLNLTKVKKTEICGFYSPSEFIPKLPICS